jgi:hypothetical protein
MGLSNSQRAGAAASEMEVLATRLEDDHPGIARTARWLAFEIERLRERIVVEERRRRENESSG